MAGNGRGHGVSDETERRKTMALSRPKRDTTTNTQDIPTEKGRSTADKRILLSYRSPSHPTRLLPQHAWNCGSTRTLDCRLAFLKLVRLTGWKDDTTSSNVYPNARRLQLYSTSMVDPTT
jgi:hypothetical protein